MVSKEPYGMEKDLKIIEGSSSAHSARLEGQFIGIFPSQPIEVIKEGKRPDDEKKGMVITGIKDLHLRIDLDVSDIKKQKGPLMEFIHMIGLDPKEADFDVLTTLEMVLRAFAKARFKNLAEVTFDGKKVYDHPEIDFDLRKVLKNIKDIDHDFSNAEEAGAVILEHEKGDTEVRIVVDKVHTRFGHDIDIRIKGEISGEMLRRIINYLEENLMIEELLRS